jgi:tetratricopeptide (TPR) repeat protein
MRSLLLLVVCLCGPAAAADKPSLQEARRHYQRGTTQYDLGEWARAIEEFKVAYEESRAPALLFNLAQSYRHLGDWQQAAHFYRTYLSMLPSAPNHVEAERSLREAEAELARAKAAPAPSPRPEDEGPMLLPTAIEPATTTTTSAPAPVASERPRSGRPLVIAGAVTAAAGAALLIGGAVLAADGASTSDRIQSLSQSGGAWSADFDALYRRGQSDATTATALFAAGAGVAVVGGILCIVGGVRQARVRRLSFAQGGR